jgi:hypothetical protein
MNIDEYKTIASALASKNNRDYVGVPDGPDRTILYGLKSSIPVISFDPTNPHETFGGLGKILKSHVYKKDGALNHVIYDDCGDIFHCKTGKRLPIQDLVDGTIYSPELCDPDFCVQILLQGGSLRLRQNFDKAIWSGTQAMGIDFIGLLIENDEIKPIR